MPPPVSINTSVHEASADSRLQRTGVLNHTFAGRRQGSDPQPEIRTRCRQQESYLDMQLATGK